MRSGEDGSRGQLSFAFNHAPMNRVNDEPIIPISLTSMRYLRRPRSAVLASGNRPVDEVACLSFCACNVYIIVNAYAIKMACVFMISTSTVVIRTGIAPPWIAILGFVLACVLLIGSYHLSWSIAVLPIWVFLLSIYILLHNLRRQQGDG
ncbi:MAG: hypothetical protein QOJ86_4003 [Bradyrhizobium sp.]|nr:hypothetical protein [Bradyrhizobium sp.]